MAQPIFPTGLEMSLRDQCNTWTAIFGESEEATPQRADTRGSHRRGGRRVTLGRRFLGDVNLRRVNEDTQQIE